MRIWQRVVLALCVLPVLAAGTHAAAGKDSGDAISDKITRQREALERLQDEIQQKREQADAAEAKRDSVLESIQDLDERLVAGRQQRYVLDRKLKKKDSELEHINNQLHEASTRIRERRQSILARLRVQYMQGRLGYLRTLLSVENPSKLHRRFEYLAAISRREYELLEAFKEDLAHFQDMERAQADARKQMLTLKRTADRKVREIRQVRQEKKHFLAKVTQQKDTYEQALEELTQSAARVDSLLKELEQRRKAAKLRPQGRAGFRGVKGTLPWPAKGKVVSFFGRQKHPHFETYVDRKGIEIRSKEGSEIRAVMDGTVAYADWLKGYGLVLILDHPNGFFSLYAHASKLLTSVGSRVHAGEVIGETGDTGMTGEDTLYFELRDGAEPIDPLHWLAKRP